MTINLTILKSLVGLERIFSGKSRDTMEVLYCVTFTTSSSLSGLKSGLKFSEAT